MRVNSVVVATKSMSLDHASHIFLFSPQVILWKCDRQHIRMSRSRSTSQRLARQVFGIFNTLMLTVLLLLALMIAMRKRNISKLSLRLSLLRQISGFMRIRWADQILLKSAQ